MPQTATGNNIDAAKRDGPAPELAEHDNARPRPAAVASASARVDAGEPASVSFAAKVGGGPGERAASSRSLGQGGNGRVGVGPGIPGAMLLGSHAGILGMNPFPIVGARIHPPLLRADTLTRERLNALLEEAATGRVALVVAEAGFGKTTLLGDWARNSSRLTAWYRLDPDDRDWLTFCRHLVASGRELDPGFASETYALLMQLGPGGPTRADIQASLVDEFAAFGAGRPQGLTLIFDDYHTVDGSDEVVPTVRALIERTGQGFSIVIASRSTPRLPLGRLRARGAVSRISGDALCFDVPETDRLFRDAYHMPIEPDVVDELVQRTEGWAALLSLVRANAEGHSKESLVSLARSLTGAAGDMHDYLAEEVLDHLDPDLSSFLERSSLLEDLDPEAAAAVADATREEADAFLAAAEDLGLVSRRDATSNHRFVPLVGEFLEARLRSMHGDAALKKMHAKLAEQFEASNWRISATHYQRAGEASKASAVVCESLDTIFGTGQYRAADDLLAGEHGDAIVLGILRSRLLMQMGATNEATLESAASVAAAEAATHRYLGLAAQNAASIAYGARRYELVSRFAQLAAAASDDPISNEVASAYAALLSASSDGSLPAIARQLEKMLAHQTRRGQLHYAGITSLNLAQCLVWLDQSDAALQRAQDAESLLGRSSRGYETVSVRLAQADAYSHLGRWEDALISLRLALDSEHPEGEVEAALEAAALLAWFGTPDAASQVIAKVDRSLLPPSWELHWRVLDLWLLDRKGIAETLASLPIEPTPSFEVAAGFRWHLSVARAQYLLGDLDAVDQSLVRVDAVAGNQRSPVQRRLAELMHALRVGPAQLSRLMGAWPARHDTLLGVFAAEVVGHLANLADPALAVLMRAAKASPHRWRDALRSAIPAENGLGLERMATLLEDIGERDDVAVLHDLNRRVKRSGNRWGDKLVVRLAPAVFLNDLGPISMLVGNRVIEGHEIRKKVLALLAFLACQPAGSATPDQILDALWPELQPDQGINSVHQTIYFLRRVIEPGYRAGRSADYLHFDDDIVSFDRTLVDCRSWRCRRLLAQRPETQQAVEELLAEYPGRFASDFSYEDWAASYRDNLHAAFLSVMERATAGQIGATDPRWRLWIGQQTLAIDPQADVIEASVIRLYRALDARAAAAEQYGHYASLLREEIGVDPPPIEDV